MKIKEGEKLPLAEFFYIDSTWYLKKLKVTELFENGQKSIHNWSSWCFYKSLLSKTFAWICKQF